MPFRGLIAALITLLVLADGALHLSLDFVLFRGNLFGRFGPPPGAPAPPPGAGGGPPEFLLPLNQMFVLNLVGYLVLLAVFWIVALKLPDWNWFADVLLVVYVAMVFYAWLRFGAPNPMGYLGYLSKGIEILLVVTLLVRLWLDLNATNERRLGSPTLANSA
jgi:hypothetical protein